MHLRKNPGTEGNIKGRESDELVQQGCASTRLGADLARIALCVMAAACCLAGSATAQQTPLTVSAAAQVPASANGMAASTGRSIESLTDEPIYPGEVVHVSVYGAPDLSSVSRVSESGDIGLPYIGALHVLGLTSRTAGQLIEHQLKASNIILDPHVLVTVESTRTAITILGEVRNPGVYSPPGKRTLSDLLAMAGGTTTNIGRVIEVSTGDGASNNVLIPWDPTMHNTSVYDRLIAPGSRIVVKPCGFAYVGGNVSKPGAYELCGTRKIRLSQVVALASGTAPATAFKHTLLIRTAPDGSRTVAEVDLEKVQKGKAADPVIAEDDVVYVPFSRTKAILAKTPDYLAALTTSLLYIYRP